MQRKQLFSLFVSIVMVFTLAGAAMAQTKKGGKAAPKANKAPAQAAPAAKAAAPTPAGENSDALDLNSAPLEKLMTLNNVDMIVAKKIVAARPFKNKNEVVSKKIMSQEDFNRIARSVTVKTGK